MVEDKLCQYQMIIFHISYKTLVFQQMMFIIFSHAGDDSVGLLVHHSDPKLNIPAVDG